MDTDSNGASRRDLGLAVGPAILIAAAAQTAQAQPAAPSLRDPRNLHPKPPFPAQQIPWPGLTSRMQPRPDHGETSYRGAAKLTGRRALITGGDSGLGRATAIAFAREGADVAIGYLPEEEEDAREVIGLIRQAGRKALALPGDIRDEAFCQHMIAEVVREFGGIDILVSNAAKQGAQKSILDITTEQFDRTMKTNLYAMFWLARAAVPHMPPGSTIISTASEVAHDPPKALLDYSMTKAAIVNFTRCLAKQLAEKGIRVNAVAPGPFWTPLQPSGGQLPEMLAEFGGATPMGRPGQPAEIAWAYVALASGEASFATGSIVDCAGGNPAP